MTPHPKLFGIQSYNNLAWINNDDCNAINALSQPCILHFIYFYNLLERIIQKLEFRSQIGMALAPNSAV
jgi:hypothetical protein